MHFCLQEDVYFKHEILTIETMNILFFLIEVRKDVPNFTGNYYEGVASIISSLKAEGHSVSLLHVTRPLKYYDFGELVSDNTPDLIAFSSMSNGFRYTRELAAQIKKVSKYIPIICGGVHATLAPEEVISDKNIDMACIGEGEDALVELCRELSKGSGSKDINNIWFKNGTEIVRNPVRPLIEDLDRLPFPDRGAFDFQNLMLSKENVAMFLAGRGCPFNCAYCCNHAIKEVYPNKGSYVRFKSPKRFIEEILDVLKKYSFVKYIAFSDDILPLRIDWLSDFATRYKSEVALPFKCNLHPNLVNEEIVSILKDAGCKMVEIGVESGNESIRMNVLNRRVADGSIKKAAQLVHKAGLKLSTYNMVGVPCEGKREIMDTVKLNATIRPEKMYSFIFYPFPKTELHRLCEEERILSSHHFDTYLEGTILKNLPVREEEIIFFHRYFKMLVKLYALSDMAPKPLCDLMHHTLDSLLLGKLPCRLLVDIHAIFYKMSAFVYVNFLRYFYSRHKGDY